MASIAPISLKLAATQYVFVGISCKVKVKFSLKQAMKA
jgi:hypothetical protein